MYPKVDLTAEQKQMLVKLVTEGSQVATDENRAVLSELETIGYVWRVDYLYENRRRYSYSDMGLQFAIARGWILIGSWGYRAAPDNIFDNGWKMLALLDDSENLLNMPDTEE